MARKYRSIAKEGIIALLLSTILFLLVLYPNVPLAMEQLSRQNIGIDRLAETGSSKLFSFTDRILESEKPPDWYIEEHIKYASDFDVWGNFDYWETPDEVVREGRTDCEGKAVLTKAVYNVLNKRGKLNVTAVIQPQQQHMYVEVRSSGNASVALYKLPEKSGLEKTLNGFAAFVNEIPLLRQIILVVGLAGIWARYGLRVRAAYEKSDRS